MQEVLNTSRSWVKVYHTYDTIKAFRYCPHTVHFYLIQLQAKAESTAHPNRGNIDGGTIHYTCICIISPELLKINICLILRLFDGVFCSSLEQLGTCNWDHRCGSIKWPTSDSSGWKFTLPSADSNSHYSPVFIYIFNAHLFHVRLYYLSLVLMYDVLFKGTKFVAEVHGFS